MITSDLQKQFFEKYYNRTETMYRLPLAENIDSFWKEELKLRRENAIFLPLYSFDGHQYFYNRTERFIAAADKILELARKEMQFDDSEKYAFSSMADEALFSSSIEGAFSTKERLNELIEQNGKPENKDEKMVYNNFLALQFVKAHLDEKIDERFILRIGEILTEGTLEEGEKGRFREGPVHVVSHTGEVIYTAPDAKYVKAMIGDLIKYVNDPEVHPIEKAAIAHIFFVTVHPFSDGNGRTARALSYAVLLKAGYSMINMIPISAVLASERGKYYKSIISSQDPANGYDFTYFSDYYIELLANTISSLEAKTRLISKYNELVSNKRIDAGSRAGKGAYWLANEMIPTITTEKWKNKFKTSFETARQDLFTLEKAGFVTRRIEGRKMFFDVKTY